jgi:hypothetical protein
MERRTLKALKPWRKLGISQRTWYRQKEVAAIVARRKRAARD